MGSGSWTSSTISVGTLVLDMYDPGTKGLIWTGSATKTIDPSANHEKNMKNLDKSMAKLPKNQTEVEVTTELSLGLATLYSCATTRSAQLSASF
jgi:hypothetical protein